MTERHDFALQSLSDAASWYRRWLADQALPLWASAGVDDVTGGFEEALDTSGKPTPGPRRSRVQARQSFVYAQAAQAGFGQGWLDVGRRGFAFYREHYQLPDGRYARTADRAGRVLDPTPWLYEQAFSLLGMAGLAGAGANDLDYATEAARLLEALQLTRHPAGGFREFGDHPFQANAHMHLLEAALAWEALSGDRGWLQLSDEIVELCLTRFIDPEGGFLREFFEPSWSPKAGDDGRLVEPGHQFEWASLLSVWGARRGEARAGAAARRLFQSGLSGIDRRRTVAVNALWDDLAMRDPEARLWPQTEYLRAALILGHEEEALSAANGLAQYLEFPTPGAWRDRLKANGEFVEEPAPASSLYHIMGAVLCLLERD